MITDDFRLCAQEFARFIADFPPLPPPLPAQAPLLVVINDWYQTPVPFFSALIGLAVAARSGRPLVFALNDHPFPDAAATACVDLIAEHCAGLARFGRLLRLSNCSAADSDEAMAAILADTIAKDRRHRYGFGMIAGTQLDRYDQEAPVRAEPALRCFAGLLARERPDCVLIPGGVANTMHGFMALARRQGVRTASYDSGSGTPRVYFSGNDVACQGWEVPALVRQIRDRADPRELDYCRTLAHQHSDRVAAGTDTMLRMPFEAPAADIAHDLMFVTSLEQDSSLLGVPGLFSTQEEWLRETITAVRRTHPRARIAVRQHPNERRFRSPYGERAIAAVEAMAAADPLITVYGTRDNIQTRALMAAAALVLSAGSTAGLEAGMLGRPVLSHTQVPYVGMAFCEKPIDREDFFTRIRHHLDRPAPLPPAAMLEAELFYYVKGYCWRSEIPVTPDPSVFRDWMREARALPFEVEAFRHVVEAVDTGTNLCMLRHAANLRATGIL